METNRPEVVVVGAGAMGCLFGGLLARSGRRVLLTDREKERVEAVRRDGIALSGVTGEHVIPVEATMDPGSIEKTSVLLFCVKAYDTLPAARQHAHLAGPDTVVLTLQNGLANIEALEEALPPGSAILAGTTSLGANLLGPGRVHFAGMGRVAMGELDGSITPRLERTAELFRNASIQVELSRDVRKLVWSKLVINAGINALTTLLSVRNGALVVLPGVHKLMLEAVREGCLVAQAQGIDLDLEECLERVESVARSTAENRSSMLMDMLAARATEVDQINGAIHILAEKKGIDARVNEVLTTLVLGKTEAQKKGLSV